MFDLLPVANGKSEGLHIRLGVARLLPQFPNSISKGLEEKGGVRRFAGVGVFALCWHEHPSKHRKSLRQLPEALNFLEQRVQEVGPGGPVAHAQVRVD